MTRLDQLITLRDAVRDGALKPGAEDVLPVAWDTLLFAYHGSVDAALALFAALLPGWAWCVESACAAEVWPLGQRTKLLVRAYYDGDNPARALLLAVIEALIAKEEG